jgi:hypothetical protein
MSWSQVLLDGLAAGLLGGIVAAGVAVYVSSREGRARHEERRLTVATRLLDSVDALASAVSSDDEQSLFDKRLALLRWTRLEGLYGGDRRHSTYVAWLRAHLLRIAILVPAQPAGLDLYSYDDRQATRNVLLAIEEETIRWMSVKPGKWSPGEWGTDHGLEEATAKVDRMARRLPVDLSSGPGVGAAEAGSDTTPTGARSRVRPRRFGLPRLRLKMQASRPQTSAEQSKHQGENRQGDQGPR